MLSKSFGSIWTFKRMTQSAMEYYVYILFDWKGLPFYVGKGKGDRWIKHETQTKDVNVRKKRKIRKTLAFLGEIPKIKIQEGLTAKKALEYEILLISIIGRGLNGPLVNMTDGGDGFNDPSGTVAAKISRTLTGRKNGPPSEETRRKIRDAQIGKSRAKRSIAERQDRSAKAKLMWSTQGSLVRPTFSMSGRKHSEETKQKMSRAVSEERRQELSLRFAALGKAQIGKKASVETRLKMSKSHKGFRHTEETKRKTEESQTPPVFDG